VPLTTNERQKRFKAKMCKKGFKQITLWIKRKESRGAKRITHGEFEKNIKKLTAGWDEDSLSQLYCLLVKIAKGKKEAARIKRK